MSAGTPTSPAFPHGIGVSPSPGSPRSRPRTPNSAPGAIGAMGGTSIEDVHRWTSADVGMWLQSSRLGSHADLFAENDIVGAVLLDVDQATLKQMGITNVGDRIRIFSAIKALKKRCADSVAAQQAAVTLAPPPHDGEMEYLDHDLSQSQSGHGSRSGFASPGQTSRRHQQSRPPPLHLTQSSYGVTPAPISPNGPGLGLSAARGLTPGGSRMGNPANNGTGRSPAVTKRALPGSSSQGFSTREQSPPSQHRKVNSAGASASTSSFGQPSRPAPRPPVSSHASRASNGAPGGHGQMGGSGRNGQSSSPTSSVFNPHLQPARSTTANGLPGNAPPLTPINESYMRTPTLTHHPSGSLSSYNLPRGGSFGGSSSRSGSQTRQLSTSSFEPPTSSSASTYSSYDSNPGLSWDSSSTYAQPFSLEDVKRRTIKFIGEDGTTRTVPVSDCRDAYDVMTRVLRKFNKPASGNSYTPTAGQQEDEEVDWNDTGDVTWSIFATSADGQMKALTDQELLAICHAPQPHDPLRERGLVLQRLNSAHDVSTVRRPIRTGRNKLEAFFGERMPGQGQGSPREADSEGPSVVTTSGKKMKRASTVSIMSGLGVSLVNKVGKGSGRNNLAVQPGLQPEPPVVAPRKARNFTGQRPPSELISSHLADYFPTAEKKVLERTARRSVYGRASMSTRSKRDSTWSFTADPDAPPIPGKESIESARGFDKKPVIQIGYDHNSSSNDSATSFSHLQPPSTYNSGWGPPTLPPVVGRSSLEDWSTSLQTAGSPTSEQDSSLRQSSSGRRASGESARSRKSLASQIRRGLASARERGDAASLLTVDEITQEVENRRESMNLAGAGGGWVVDEDGVPIPVPRSSRNAGSLAPSTRPSSGLSGPVDSDDEDDRDDGLSHRPGRGNSPVPSAPGEESDRHRGDPYAVSRDTTSRASSVSELRKSLSDHDGDGENFEDGLSDDDDEDEDEEDEEDLGVAQRGGPTGKAPIKWIKGALIGAGSFGNVFLGMNAKNGLLMAVKQVEIPSGDSQKDKRKMSMLEALEREIELLKTMQHENIVQYLDSYGDGVHLNIFLEYVPGGSVVTLLRNYGAFEEELVRIWVRQILQGLSYLHGRDIVHRDIKGANILVDTTGGVKISDFGISKKVESDLLVSARSHRPSLQGSVFWMAPEVVKQTSYTRKADIWSLGCLIVEMISGTHPWATLNQMQALFKIGSSAKPAIPDDVSADAITFLNKTFEIDHNLRPSADELLQEPFITDELVVDDVPSPATAHPHPAGFHGSASTATASSTLADSTSNLTGTTSTLNGSSTLATTASSATVIHPKNKGPKAQARKGKSVEALGAASRDDSANATYSGGTNGDTTNANTTHSNAQTQADYERAIATQSSLLGGGVGLL